MTAADHAIFYALYEWHPLAIRPNDKRPILPGWQTAPLANILAAIDTQPGANVGIAVPAGLMVLDVDTKTNGLATLAAMVAQHEALPDTLTATTPTGGKHIWFRLPPGVTVGNRVAIAAGLDVRTDGGYVVAPPSVINGKAYSWDNWNPANGAPVVADVPSWLLALVNRPRETLKAPAGEPFKIPEGQRNRTLFEASASMSAKGFSHDTILAATTSMNSESCNPPLDDDEVERIVASASRYEPDAQPWQIFSSPGLLPAGALPVATAQAPAMRFKLLPGADLCNAAPMRWMVRGVLPVEGLAALFGASGSGKSFLMLDIGCAVAGGDYEWFGRRVNQCPVTYVCLEGEAGMGKRVKAWSLHHKQPVPDALQFITQPFDLLSDDVPELAKAVIAGGAGGLVILDTLNRAAPGADENSSVDMGNLIAAAKRLQNMIGGLVLLVHHTGKDTTKGLRGHSSLYAALDGAIEVIKTETRRAWSVAKTKEDATGDAYPFKLEIVPVGTDDEGEEITSCVAVPDESGEGIKARRTALGANQKIAFDVLGEPLRKSPHIGKEGAPVGRPCLDYTEAVEIVAERMPTDAKHRKSRAISAIGGLVSNGYLGMKVDWLWANR